jgi:hypothetical protein
MYFKWVKLHSRVEKTGKRTPTQWFEIAAEAMESGSQASFASFIIANWRTSLSKIRSMAS